MATQASASRAAVIGGSMAGLLAARVLADHFDEVVLVERDPLPEGPEQRKGVPQGRQIHLLLARGSVAVERLFPGYRTELEAAGAVPVAVPADLIVHGPAGWADRRATGWEALSASRPLIEATVRRRLRELPGVTVLDGHEVTAVTGSPDGGSVTGVTVRGPDTAGGTVDVDADLVVDASGRGSRAVAWLTELGYPAPEQTHIDPNVAYASRVFRIPDGFSADWKAVMLLALPPSLPRSGYLFPIEGGRWIVGLMGAGGEQPPTDDEGWHAFARSLRHPVLADAVADAEPLTPIRSHRGTSNRMWHFEKMRRRPERFVVLGDAACAFNPIYGQGITTAAMAAETLDACLRDHRRRHGSADLAGLATRFSRALARVTAAPWMLATGEDLRFPSTTGLRPNALLRAQYRYEDRVAAASTGDPAVSDVYLRVLGMLERPSALFRPHVLAAAARTRARVDGGAAGPPPPSPHAAVPQRVLERSAR